MDIGTTTDRLDAAANVLKERVFGILKPVIDPSTVPLLVHQARRLHKSQVPASIRLRHFECFNELADAQTFLDRQQTTSQAEPESVTERIEEIFRFG
ncbi:MAG: hypothetical protein AUH13_31130 [Acidobacteria bacterium 13_2_20CM_58_27]|nr:MAG: hypothetical protein AUH13_31130 [Acidobacteria bacterium 13_2_20CM_58_27]